MKQGRATHSGMGATKVEPRSQAISPAAVSKIGIKQGNHVSDGGHTIRHSSTPVYQGRGLKAPMASSTSHPKGSQGRHK